MEPQYVCQLCDAKAYPNFIRFEELIGWSTHSFQKDDGAFYLVTCPTCSLNDSDLLQARWMYRVRAGDFLWCH